MNSKISKENVKHGGKASTKGESPYFLGVVPPNLIKKKPLEDKDIADLGAFSLGVFFCCFLFLIACFCFGARRAPPLEEQPWFACLFGGVQHCVPICRPFGLALLHFINISPCLTTPPTKIKVFLQNKLCAKLANPLICLFKKIRQKHHFGPLTLLFHIGPLTLKNVSFDSFHKRR